MNYEYVNFVTKIGKQRYANNNKNGYILLF